MILSFTFLNVNAEEVYYTNLNGVEMTETEYNRIVDMLSEQKASIITEDEFERLVSGNIVDNGTIYQKVMYDQDGNILYETEVSELEYNNAPEQNNFCENGNASVMSSSSGYHETSYKKLTVTLSDFGSNDFLLTANLHWKKMPYCRSYDVFAFMLTHFNYSNVTGTQTYYKNYMYNNITYNTSSSGYKSFSDGAGFSMNLKDDTDISSLDLTVMADLAINNFNYTTAHAYVSYQHAQNDLTQAQSKSYTLDIVGLGNVIYYSNYNISSIYDHMTGIELTTPI